jgi:hypothetical protein
VTVGATGNLLDDIRAQIAPADAVLKEARERRDTVCTAARSFRGAARTFASGSLAHGTANCPIHLRDKGLDADSGIVLDRRVYPLLGPDSPAGRGPNQVVRDMCDHLRPLVQRKYPRATLQMTKRAIFVKFNEPLPSGEDPTVDLVVALDHRDSAGLWIPNTEQQRWDPSDPEAHTALMTGEPRQLRVVRAHAVRLAKAENKRTNPAVLCSFNLEALALIYVHSGVGDAQALLALWQDGAKDLRRRLTPDPAGVSAPIKVADRPEAVRRLQEAADRLSAALSRDDDEDWVRDQLRPLWPDFVAESAGASTKARTAAALRVGAPLGVLPATGALATSGGTNLKSPRSWGTAAHSER